MRHTEPQGILQYLVMQQLGDLDRQNKRGCKKGVSRKRDGTDKTIFIIGTLASVVCQTQSRVFLYDIGKVKVASK